MSRSRPIGTASRHPLVCSPILLAEIQRLADMSFQWPRTQNEYLHQSARALLPVRAGRHIGDADESPKKIDRIEILPYIAALDRPLHECANRFPNLAVRRFEHLFRIADQRVEHRGDDLLRGDGSRRTVASTPARLPPVAGFQQTSVLPQRAFRPLYDTPPPEGLRASESGDTRFQGRRPHPWRSRRDWRPHRTERTPALLLPECAPDSAAHRCGAFGP